MLKKNDPAWREIHDEALTIDLHAHPSLKSFVFRRSMQRISPAVGYTNPLSVRSSFPKLAQGGIDVLCSTIYAPERELLDDFFLLRLLKFLRFIKRDVFTDSYFPLTLAMLDEIEKLVEKEKNPETNKPWAEMARSITQLNEIVSRKQDKRIAFVHSIEGAHSLDGDLNNLVTLFDRGVAYMTLAHFYHNEVTEPVFPFPEYARSFGGFRRGRDLTKGLETFGQNVVEKMKELGMIIDITHCTPQARRDVFQIIGKKIPLIASHVGAYNINPNPYNLQDWEIKKIAKTGGVVGVIFMNYWLVPHARVQGIDFIMETIKHLVQIAGIEHVALGSDFDGLTDPPDDLTDARQMPYLTQRLVAEGFTVKQIEKILGLNVLRVLRDGWKKEDTP